MITKCNYCDYQKSTPAPENLLRVVFNEPEGEDKELWARRLVETMGLKDYHSVRAHMRQKHKDSYSKDEKPTGIWEERERKIMGVTK